MLYTLVRAALHMSCVTSCVTQVVVVAGIMEFLGAVLLGAGVTSTIKCACLRLPARAGI